MKQIIMTALVVGLSMGNFACGGKSSSDAVQITGIRLTIRFDPTVLKLDRVRIEGYDTQDSSEVFPAGELPQTTSGILTSGVETAVILLPDNLSGREILIKVWGKKGQDLAAYGNTTVVLERGVITDAEVNLDAPPVCGDGTVTQVEEVCDTAIPQGQSGACPQDCDDQDVCTTDTMNDPNTCQSSCHHATIKTCIHGDGCCPDGCEPATDSDCAAVCGDGLIGEGETCDTGISPGQAGSCPTDCDDGSPCTTDKLVGQGSCQAHCTYDPITSCMSNDGCCPNNCSLADDGDLDCPGCGNARLETNLGEECDDGNAANLDGCTTSCTIQSGQIGDPCNVNNDCNTSLTCLTDSSLPGGYCSQKNCSALTNPCPGNAVCTDQLATGGLSNCAEACQADQDCRWNEGYSCQSVGNGDKACVPDN